MQVKDGLPRVCSVIGDQPVAAMIDSCRLGRVDTQVDHSIHGAVVEVPKIAQRGNVLSRHDKQMNRGLRIDIAKRDGMFILGNDIRSKFAGDNAAKETI